MKKVYIYQGLPGSGKSTAAKARMAENPGVYKRVNKDDLRAMLDNGHWSKGNEKFVLQVRDQVILAALEAGKHVLVDDTNLHPKHLRNISELVKGLAQVEVVDFMHIDVDTCIERDLKRPDPVGEQVIRRMWSQYLEWYPEQREAMFTRIGDALAGQGYAVVDDFLGAPFQETLRAELNGLLGRGALKEAGIGNSEARLVEKSIRGDQIYWLEEEGQRSEGQRSEAKQSEGQGSETEASKKSNSATPAGLEFLQQVHHVREFLRGYLMLPLRGVEAHYAVYPAGTFYQRHLDQFQRESHRKLSFICYLNANWQPGDGGELVIFPEGEAEVRVEPIGGRLVIFRSDLLEHEVLTTEVPRVGITGWMLDCEPGLRFL